jgi:RimJ/RimL family protein N-acetyltransferase
MQVKQMLERRRYRGANKKENVMYIKKLIGKKCFLSPMEISDADKYTTWLNDQEVVKHLSLSTAVITVESEKGFLSSLSQNHNYGIIDFESEQLIGSIGLMNIDHIHQTAEIGIFIGNKDYWGKGFGSEALSLLISYAYQTLNLHNIMLKVFSINTRAIKCYEKIGFKKIGVIREAINKDKQKHDIILMDILPTDFKKV